MEEIFVEDKQKFLDEQPPPFDGYKLTESGTKIRGAYTTKKMVEF
jgi:hypothetical protein